MKLTKSYLKQLIKEELTCITEASEWTKRGAIFAARVAPAVKIATAGIESFKAAAQSRPSQRGYRAGALALAVRDFAAAIAEISDLRPKHKDWTKEDLQQLNKMKVQWEYWYALSLYRASQDTAADPRWAKMALKATERCAQNERGAPAVYKACIRLRSRLKRKQNK